MELNHKLEEGNDPEQLSEICNEIGVKETQIGQLYLQWEELAF